MKLKALTTDNQEEIEKIWNSYFHTFPPEERRNKENFLQTFLHEKYISFALFYNEKFVGYAFCWAFENFTFLEHFEIFHPFRNQKLGEKTLDLLKNKFKNIILESEPSTQNDIANRRIHFYQRNGFNIIDKDYWQPPYSLNQKGINLWLMANFTPKNLKKYKQKIYEIVYNFST